MERRLAKCDNDFQAAKQDIESKEEEIRKLQRNVSEAISENNLLQKSIMLEREENQSKFALHFTMDLVAIFEGLTFGLRYPR